MSLSSEPNAPGRLSKAFTRMFMKHATVAGCETIAEGFRLITLEGPGLAACAWTPGHKIQIAMGSAFVARTYTPIEWDAVAGRTRILGYAHGAGGPGSAWVRGLETGAECDLFGPRGSLNVTGVDGPLAVVGDETSIGFAHALARQDRARAVTCRFEVGDIEAGRRVASHLELGAMLFGRTEDDAHLAEIEATLPPLIAAGATFVLTGRAGTIQRLRQSLKRRQVPAARIYAKAYWAPGKSGLD